MAEENDLGKVAFPLNEGNALLSLACFDADVFQFITPKIDAIAQAKR